MTEFAVSFSCNFFTREVGQNSLFSLPLYPPLPQRNAFPTATRRHSAEAARLSSLAAAITRGLGRKREGRE